MDMTTTAPPRRGLAWVFYGGEGLRAGWSLLLFVVLVTMLSIVVNLILSRVVHLPPAVKGSAGDPFRVLLTDGGGFAIFVLVSFIVSRVERRPFARYGLQPARRMADLLAGLAWGVAMLSVLIGLLYVAGALAFDGVALGADAAVRYGVLWFAAFFMVGLFEEYLTRGFLQYTVARGVAGIVGAVAPHYRYARTVGFLVAAAIFSVGIFALGHVLNQGETTMGLVSVALAGVTFAYVLYRTGSLWWAIGFHATWDWAQSYLYGVRDSGLAVQGHLLVSHPAGAPLLSGGTTGPEGSILVVPVLLLTILVIHRTLPRRATAFDA